MASLGPFCGTWVTIFPEQGKTSAYKYYLWYKNIDKTKASEKIQPSSKSSLNPLSKI